MTIIATPIRSAGTALRLIRQLGELFGPGAQPGQRQEREWASATFSGARHSIEYRLPLPGPDAAPPAVLMTLAEHEFALPGDIVADCTVAIRPRLSDDGGRIWLPVLVEILTVTAD